MAYNSLNLLSKIVDIQRITLEHTSKGVTQEWVFNNVVHPNYRICKATYYNYLKTNAKSEIKKITNEQKN